VPSLKNISILLSVFLLFCACKKKETLISQALFCFSVPEYVERPSVLNEVPVSGVELGEKLFFDVNLSSNKQISCSSCHERTKAFSDGLVLSNKGVSGEQLPRHSPVLFNLAWQKGFFWDGGAPDLSSQALGPLFSEHEMNADLTEIIKYLKADLNYSKMFKSTFEDGTVNSLNILKALSWYQLSLTSFDTQYDKFLKSNDSTLLTTEQKEGLEIYNSQCNSCHTLPLASTYDYANNELDSQFDYPEEDERLGRNRITNDINDLGKYKIPSLRNISYSAPYMHDGRFTTLDEVLSHYQDLHTANIKTKLSASDKEKLKQFLLILNDHKFIEK
jgi:cytochrome c peroxidase